MRRLRNDADDEEEDLEFAKKRRGGIKQGYTESDDEELLSDGGKPADDADDMFSAEAPAETKKKRKGDVELLTKKAVDDEGAERNDDIDEEEVEKIEQFNMDQELEEGGFDADFNYIRSKDEHQMHDNWLQGITKEEMKKEAKEREEEAEPDDNASETKLWYSVLSMMRPRESLAGAMTRLRTSSKKEPAWKAKKKRKAGSTVDESVMAADAKALDDLIGLSDALLKYGHYDAVNYQYEAIVRLLRQKEALAEDWTAGDPLPQFDQARSTSQK
ncbi:hypothetical protein HK101_000364 [Irineochytrium annulatum]|nr:hypothetical protein HK101_000364 [Irineochytrium annulatum]